MKINLTRSIPGLTATIAIAVLSLWIEQLPFWPFTVGETSAHLLDNVIVALLLGMAIRRFGTVPTSWGHGIEVAAKALLPIAIVLMGVKLDLAVVQAISWHALVINVLCVLFSFFVTMAICKKLDIAKNTSTLIAIGTAICGGSAIVAAAPVIKASKTETSVSIATITLFGILAIFLYPTLGHIVRIDQTLFGLWAGTAIQAIPQVIAAGYAYGNAAGEVAVVVKLFRILLLAPFILGLSLSQHRQIGGTGRPPWKTLVPPFILGFIVMMVLSSLGWIPHITIADTTFDLKYGLGRLSSFLITVAMASIGLGTDLRGMMKANMRILAAGFSAAAILGIVSYALIVSLA